MSYETNTAIVIKDGDGTTTTFSGIIQWITDESEVTVVYVDPDNVQTTLTLGIDYNITNIIQPDSENGIAGSYDLTTIGTSIPVPIPSGSKLYLLQNLAIKQTAGLDAGNDFDLATIEKVLDRAYVVLAQLKALVDKAVGKSLTSTDPKPILPDAVDKEVLGWAGFDLVNYAVPTEWPTASTGQLLGWGADGNPANFNIPGGAAAYADQATTDAGTATNQAVTPATLKGSLADVTATNAGTATNRALTPGGFAGSKFNPIGTHTLPLMAGAITPYPGATASVPNTINTTTNNTVIPTQDFADGSTLSCYFNMIWPESSDGGTINFRYYWTHDTSSGDCEWRVSGLALGHGDVIDQVRSAAIITTQTSTGAGKLNITPWSDPLTVTNTLGAGKFLHLRFARQGGDGADTLTSTARLVAIEMRITNNRGTDF